MAPAVSSRLTRILIAGAVVAVGVFLRVWQWPDQILADDEWHALNALLHHDAWHILRHFGHADHSIPLTLYYGLLAETVGLSEWGMRLPLLLAGLATVVLVPWLLRTHLEPMERLCMAALLAISPLAVYYSRTARPYALTILLTFIALWALLHWWREPRIRRAVLYVSCTAMAAWLHPVTLAFTGAGFLFVAAGQSWVAVRHRSPGGIWAISGLGLFTLLPLLLLLGPPLATDWQALAGKTGEHGLQLATLARSVELLAGTGHGWLAGLWVLLGVVGVRVFWNRDRAAAAYWLWVALLPLVVIALSSAAWIHHALVYTRYNLPVLLIFSAFVAIGLSTVTRLFGSLRCVGLAGVLVVFFLLGPLPALLPAPNQFTGHMSYQFDYQASRNIYNRHLGPAYVPDFYHRLGATPLRYTLIEAPWHMEWHFNRLHFFQEIHRQRVMIGFLDGLCARGRYGEFPLEPDLGLRMQHFVHLASLQAEAPRADFLVMHRSHPDGASGIPDLDRCIEILRARFGPAWYEDPTLRVFRLRPESGDGS